MLGQVGPVPTLSQPWDFVVALSVVVTALAVLWRVVVKPSLDALTEVNRSAPVLAKIAKDFGNGESLKAITGRLEKAVHEAAASNRKQDEQIERMEKAINAIVLRKSR